jgi:hypothetical protein
MQTSQHRSHPVISQTKNNTTLWIGHLKTDLNDHFAGQTFQCPSEGLVDNIQIFSSSVHEPGDMALSLHEFDPETKTWGPSIGDSSMSFQKGDDSRWISFHLTPVSLKKDITYGFRLHTDDAMIGIGEAASHSHQPFSFGQAWKGDSKNEKGHYYRYFSLAFKVEMCA